MAVFRWVYGLVLHGRLQTSDTYVANQGFVTREICLLGERLRGNLRRTRHQSRRGRSGQDQPDGWWRGGGHKGNVADHLVQHKFWRFIMILGRVYALRENLGLFQKSTRQNGGGFLSGKKVREQHPQTIWFSKLGFFNFMEWTCVFSGIFLFNLGCLRGSGCPLSKILQFNATSIAIKMTSKMQIHP